MSDIVERLRERDALLHGFNVGMFHGLYSEAADEIERLRSIIRALFSDWPEPAIENMDGFDAQDFGERHGILIPVKVDEPCGVECACAAYGDFPLTCYRLAPEFRAGYSPGGAKLPRNT